MSTVSRYMYTVVVRCEIDMKMLSSKQTSDSSSSRSPEILHVHPTLPATCPNLKSVNKRLNIDRILDCTQTALETLSIVTNSANIPLVGTAISILSEILGICQVN